MSSGLLTVADDYIAATIRQANTWVDDEGFIVAHVQSYPGVRAHGDDVQTCRIALAQEIEQWVRTWLHRDYVLPSSTISTSTPPMLLFSQSTIRTRKIVTQCSILC